jgi:hypothetical protein
MGGLNQLGINQAGRSKIQPSLLDNVLFRVAEDGHPNLIFNKIIFVTILFNTHEFEYFQTDEGRTRSRCSVFPERTERKRATGY